MLLQGRAQGVAGFLNRGLSNEDFVAGLEVVARGGELFESPRPQRSTTVELTPRESQLVALLVQGLRNKEIGSCLGITEGTVRVYLSKLFIKVGARDRLELAVFGMKNTLFGQSSWDGRDGFVTGTDESRAKPVLRTLLLVEPARRRGYSDTRQTVNQQPC
jgi:DNA-binding CsgD family transcriptional regulator